MDAGTLRAMRDGPPALPPDSPHRLLRCIPICFHRSRSFVDEPYDFVNGLEKLALFVIMVQCKKILD
jgi:hypothetical protein